MRIYVDTNNYQKNKKCQKSLPSGENDQVRIVELDVHGKPNCIEVDHRK